MESESRGWVNGWFHPEKPQDFKDRVFESKEDALKHVEYLKERGYMVVWAAKEHCGVE